jgi:hypothetical protein
LNKECSFTAPVQEFYVSWNKSRRFFLKKFPTSNVSRQRIKNNEGEISNCRIGAGQEYLNSNSNRQFKIYPEVIIQEIGRKRGKIKIAHTLLEIKENMKLSKSNPEILHLSDFIPEQKEILT